jgi:hypothetical protein
MGNWASWFSKPISDPDDVMNYILRGIFNKIDIVDMMALSDPEKCPSYIIFGAKALNDLFLNMKLHAGTDKEGFVYFRKVSTFQEGFQGDLLKEHQQNCKEISKFFVTLLRIFGALYLSIYNTNTPIDKLIAYKKQSRGIEFAKTSDIFATVGGARIPGVILDREQLLSRIISDERYFSKTRDSNIIRLNTSRVDSEIIIRIDNIGFEDGPPANPKRIKQPLQVEYIFTINKERSAFSAFMGINDTNTLRLGGFEWIDEPSIYSKKRIGEVTEKSAKLAVSAERIGCIIGERAEQHSFPSCLMALFKQAQLELIPPERDTTSYLIKWGYIADTRQTTGFTQFRNVSNMYFDWASRNSESARVLYRHTIKVSETKSKLVNVLCEIRISRIADPIVRYSVEIRDVSLRDTSQDIQERFTPLNEIKTTRNFTAPTETSIPTTPDGLSFTDFVVKIIKSTFNPNYGISSKAYQYDKSSQMYLLPKTSDGEDDLRKLQKLLIEESTVPACNAYAKLLLDNIKSNPTSHICNRRFRSKLGVPVANESVAKSSSVYNLWLLFSDSIDSGARQISTNPTWGEFKSRMKDMEEYTREDRTGSLCKADEDIPVNPTLRDNLKGVMRELIKRQEDHVQRALDIIWLLFDENTAVSKEGFKINANLYRGGMKQLEEIRLMCVDLLTNYQVGCEDTYLKGVNMILDNKDVGPPLTRERALNFAANTVEMNEQNNIRPNDV